jgi:hypothetical protein
MTKNDWLGRRGSPKSRGRSKSSRQAARDSTGDSTVSGSGDAAIGPDELVAEVGGSQAQAKVFPENEWIVKKLGWLWYCSFPDGSFIRGSAETEEGMRQMARDRLAKQ